MTWTFFFISSAVLLVGFLLGAMWARRSRPHRDWQHSFLTGMMSIFHEGEMAQKRGASLRDNPYLNGTPEARSWAFGWAWVGERVVTDEEFAQILLQHLPHFDPKRLEERLASGEVFTKEKDLEKFMDENTRLIGCKEYEMAMLRERSAMLGCLIAGVVEAHNDSWKGAKVRVNSGKYKDRLAKVTGVIPDASEGLLFCCMVIREGGSGFLNDGESRWYRPLRDFRMA